MDKNLSFLGICAGQGALLFPFRRNLLANIECRGVFHTKNEEQWHLNFGNIPFLKGKLPDNLHPDVIISSPDCGASSIMRLSKVKELGDPAKNKSLNLVIKGIIKYEPKIFFIEYLPRLINLKPIKLFTDLFMDYQLVFHTNRASDFGNSQVSRKRLVIIGINKKSKKYLNKFNNIFPVNNVKLTRNLLEEPNGQNYMIPMDKVLAMYDYRKLPKKINLNVGEIKKLWNTDFIHENKWPIKTEKMNTLPGVYRLKSNSTPLTLRPADRQFRPDGLPLGILDFKNIQGFPKRFHIYMDKSNYLYWLNKARYTIAKGAIYEMGVWFKKCLQN